MAAATPALFSSLFGDAVQWENFSPSYDVLTSHFANGANVTQAPACRDGLVQLATRTPVVLAVVSDAECDVIYLVHSLTLFPADVCSPTTMDGSTVGLIGNHPASAVAVILPQVFFALSNHATALDVATIQGLTGHGAAPPVYRQGPHVAGAANTSQVRCRRAMILPPSVAARALADASADGTYTLLGFFNSFLNPQPLDPVERASIEPLTQWWRAASTNTAAGASVISASLSQPNSPRELGRLTAWSNRVKDDQMKRLGVGGPGLSNAAFAHGVAELKSTMVETHRATLEYDRDKKRTSYTETHGELMAIRLQRLCGVARDEDLPEIHHLLLKAPKSRVYSILSAQLAARAQEANIGLISSSAPVATTKMVDEVFRNYNPNNDGLVFGKGLSPFGIMCDGHEGIHTQLQKVEQSIMLGEGVSVSLSDHNAVLSYEVLFPTRPFVAIEKLCGWSVLVDVFHGTHHPISLALHAAVKGLAPLLSRVETLNMDTPGAGRELICRIMFDMQQDYFLYVSEVAAGANPAVPDFKSLLRRVATHRAADLNSLPSLWYDMVNCPQKKTVGPSRAPTLTPATAPLAMRVPSSGTSGVNPHVDRRLMKRFGESGHQTITAMIGDRKLEYPKQGPKQVCMAWALKGSCPANCRRADMHVRYNADTVKALNKFLTDCGVKE
jgi:hypothetical protein